MASSYHVGQRVQTADNECHRGTVRYVGPVAGQEGDWIGVEWDDPQRGKHDGSTGGQQYFKCSVAGAGTFARPHKLDPGVTFVEGLKARYRPEGKQSADGDEMYIMSVRKRRMIVELVGREKIAEQQGKLEDLQNVALPYSNVHSAGLPGEIRTVAPSIRELDLAGNLLSDWQSVSQICSELSGLEVLDLSSNLLQLPGPSDASDENNSKSWEPQLQPAHSAFAGLRALILNDCKISWPQVMNLESSLLALEELHLCKNEIVTLQSQACQGNSEAFVEGFASLQLLDLEDNRIEEWKEVARLSRLKRLEQLNVSGNLLKDVEYQSSEATPAFPSLKALLLGNNRLATWQAIDALSRFPHVQAVRLSDNPITDPAVGGAARYMLVARIGGLTALNGSQVIPRERKDSEIRYLRHVAAQYPSGTGQEEILKQHPRFPLLVKLHQLSSDMRQGGATANKRMAEELITVSLTCVAAGAGEKPPSSKKVPGSITVAKLKLLCERLFKIKAGRQRLFVKTEESPHPTPLDDDNETLNELGLGSSPALLIDEVEPADLQKAQAVKSADLERRLQEQLHQVNLFRHVQKAEVEDSKRMLAAQP